MSPKPKGLERWNRMQGEKSIKVNEANAFAVWPVSEVLQQTDEASAVLVSREYGLGHRVQ